MKTCLAISYWSEQEELTPPAVRNLASYLPTLVAFWKQWSWGEEKKKTLLMVFQFFHWCDIIGYNIETSCQNKGEAGGRMGTVLLDWKHPLLFQRDGSWDQFAWRPGTGLALGCVSAPAARNCSVSVICCASFGEPPSLPRHPCKLCSPAFLWCFSFEEGCVSPWGFLPLPTQGLGLLWVFLSLILGCRCTSQHASVHVTSWKQKGDNWGWVWDVHTLKKKKKVKKETAG